MAETAKSCRGLRIDNRKNCYRIFPVNNDMETQLKQKSIVGQKYFYGDGCRKNYRKAFPYLLEAAMAGDIHPQNLVGYCYNLGLGVTKDSGLAAYWYEVAGRNRHRDAVCNLAMMYERGKGVEKNLRKAFLLYKKGALLRDSWSQCNLGICYMNGIGTKENLHEGIKWFRKAAKKGDDKAQFNLGLAYLDGDGVRKSTFFARHWLEKASEQHNRKAIVLLKRMANSE